VSTPATFGPKLMDAERRRICLELRAAGLTEEAIAKEMTSRGHTMTRTRVHRTLVSALERLARDESYAAEQVRQLDLTRIDQAIQVLWPLVRAGNLKAMREYRAFIDQRARLLGTYAAQKTEVEATVNHRIDPADREEIARLEEAFVTASRPADAQLDDDDVVEVEQAPPSPAAEILGIEAAG
jgi:hypothetical protein